MNSNSYQNGMSGNRKGSDQSYGNEYFNLTSLPENYSENYSSQELINFKNVSDTLYKCIHYITSERKKEIDDKNAEILKFLNSKTYSKLEKEKYISDLTLNELIIFNYEGEVKNIQITWANCVINALNNLISIYPNYLNLIEIVHEPILNLYFIADAYCKSGQCLINEFKNTLPRYGTCSFFDLIFNFQNVINRPAQPYPFNIPAISDPPVTSPMYDIFNNPFVSINSPLSWPVNIC